MKRPHHADVGVRGARSDPGDDSFGTTAWRRGAEFRRYCRHLGTIVEALQVSRRAPRRLVRQHLLSQIWRAGRREQPKAIAISRRPQASFIGQTALNFVVPIHVCTHRRALRLCHACNKKTVFICSVRGPIAGSWGGRRKWIAAAGSGAAIQEDPVFTPQ